MAVYVFDGSFEGLLTAIFEYYERKPACVQLVEVSRFQPIAFEDVLTIYNDEKKAMRVWKGLSKKISAAWTQCFFGAYLSEQAESYQHLFEFARYVFDSPGEVTSNFGNAHVLAVAQINKKVHREKHRMEAFIRFRKTGNGMFMAHIDPDFNVLPLILKHFKNRYADQPWIIYDLRRKYGIYYDLEQVQEVTFSIAEGIGEDSNITPALPLDEQEALYAVLWKDYFKSTNIPARKNMKLHIQHVPRRYWKYLTEKQAY